MGHIITAWHDMVEALYITLWPSFVLLRRFHIWQMLIKLHALLNLFLRGSINGGVKYIPVSKKPHHDSGAEPLTLHSGGLPNWSNSSYCGWANLIFFKQLKEDDEEYTFRKIKWPVHTVKRLLSCLLCKEIFIIYLHTSGYPLCLCMARCPPFTHASLTEEGRNTSITNY